VPEEMPRARFMREHAHVLDDCLRPIYDCGGVTIGQDTAYALPGFYIIGLHDQVRALDYLDSGLHQRISLILMELRKGMRSVLNIDYVHVYYQEKPDESCSVHWWVMPVNKDEERRVPRIVDLDVRNYLSQFRFSEERETILKFNQRMVDYFNDIGL
jgi:hypothetical protein